MELSRDVKAPSVARATVAERIADLDLCPSIRETLLLLVSELVTNAVLHSQGPIDLPIVLTMTMADDVLRVAVADSGAGFTPEPRCSRSEPGGYGLYLVEKTARRWGIDTISGTRVWFELARGA